MKKMMGEITTITYDMGKNWRVDVVMIGYHEIEAWIYHKDYGVKSLMFGQYRKMYESDVQDFLGLIEANFNDYKRLYEEDYMD